MSTFSVGGLATGLDTKSIIDQLLQIDGRPKQQLEWKQQLWTARRTAWSDLNSRLLTLGNLANTLLQPTTWAQGGGGSGSGTWSATSGDPSSLSASVTGTPTAGSYGVEVLQLAQGEITDANGSLGTPTSGVFHTGQWFEGTANIVEGNENITALRTGANPNTSMGFNAGSKITMNYTVNGTTNSAVFTVGTTGTKLTQLASWVGSTIGNGASAAWVNGELQVTTAPGTANELNALSFTAVNAVNATLTNFNSHPSAAGSSLVAATNGDTVLADETITITQGASSWNVDLTAGDTLADVVNKINGTSGIGVIASNNAGKLRLSSNAAGASAGFTVTGGSTVGLLALSETQSAQDAQYRVNGTFYSSVSNFNVQGAIPGIALNLLHATNTTLDVAETTAGGQTVAEQWIDDTRQKIVDFCNAYNGALDHVYQKTQGETRVINPKTLGEYLQGPMARDVQFASVGFDLRQHTGAAVSGLAAGENMLADIGISTTFNIGGGSANGHLTVDETKLEDALRTNPTMVQDLLTKIGTGSGITDDDGIVRRINEQVSLLRVGGRVDISMTGASNQVKTLQDAINRASDRLDRKKEYYERMFSSLETRIGTLQTQFGWLSGTFAQMSAQAGM